MPQTGSMAVAASGASSTPSCWTWPCLLWLSVGASFRAFRQRGRPGLLARLHPTARTPLQSQGALFVQAVLLGGIGGARPFVDAPAEQVEDGGRHDLVEDGRVDQ